MARNLRAIATTSVAVAALGAGVLAASAPASADPASGYRPFVGVGSDTTQDVLNALAGDVTGTTGITTKVASYNAFGTAQIKVSSTGPTFDRPAGSGAGVKALSDSETGTPFNGVNIEGQIDFARSSSGPSASGTDLTYVPFARDAVSYAYRGAAGKIGKLTTAQLNAVYSANTPVTINGVKVTGVLPQSSSGTRKFFLGAIGVTTVGSTVVQTSSPENDGSILTATNQVVPFSSAQWIAQKNKVVTDTTGAALLGAPNNKPAATTNATTGLLQPSAAFYNAAPFGRNVYNVVPTNTIGVTGKAAALFTGDTAAFCGTKAKAIVKKFGFALIAASSATPCGSTSITGPLTP